MPDGPFQQMACLTCMPPHESPSSAITFKKGAYVREDNGMWHLARVEKSEATPVFGDSAATRSVNGGETFPTGEFAQTLTFEPPYAVPPAYVAFPREDSP